MQVPVRDEAAVQTVLERVQTWMREQQIDGTTVCVGPEIYRVSPSSDARAPATRPDPGVPPDTNGSG